MVGCGIVGRWGECWEGVLGVVVGGCSAIAAGRLMSWDRLQSVGYLPFGCRCPSLLSLEW